jgi:nucleoside-diphosphate-sugar epimerase
MDVSFYFSYGMNMHKEVVIITGCCGRIGVRVFQRLNDQYQIVGFDKGPCSSGQHIIIVDLAEEESVSQAFVRVRNEYGNRIASVIHLAAYYSFDQQHSPLYDKVTVEGTEKLLRALADFEVDQFIFSSTMLVHAPGRPGHPINEDSVVKPNWDYPLSKVKTEKAIHQLRGKMSTVILRIAGVYDDHCHSIPISHQIQRIYENQLEAHVFSGNIHHGAAFLHMDDLIDAIERAVKMRKELPPELTLLIGEPQTLSYDQLQRKISYLVRGKAIKTFRVPKLIAKMGAWVLGLFGNPFIKPWMIDLADDHYELNISRARKYLSWTPKHSLESTLPKMIEELKADPDAWYRLNGLKK